MPFGEDMARAAFQVLFEMLSLFNRLECHVDLDFPSCELRSVWALPSVMVLKPPPEVRSMTNVTLVRMAQALDYVCVKHVKVLPSIAWNPEDEKSSFAEPMEIPLL
jgi:hypothetical protein